MSNDVQRNPFVLDTASSGTVVWNGYIRMESLVWADVNAQGDSLVLQDKNGKEIFSFLSPGPGFYNFFKPMWINGLIVQQLDSGKVYITIN